MTTNQDPLSNEEINSSYYKFRNKENIEIVISLLKEYSDKLLRLCDSRDRYWKNIKIYFFGLIVIYILFIFILAILLPIFSLLHKSIIIVIITLLLILIGYGLIEETEQKLRLLEGDMKIYATKLEKLVRITSQINEHFLIEIAIKLEVDFRLTDAESALWHYNNTRETLFLRILRTFVSRILFYVLIR